MELKGMFPNGLELYRNLEVLDLSSNDLSEPIPSNIDERLPSVRTLARVKEAKVVIMATTLFNRKNAKKKAEQDSSELPTMQLLQIPNNSVKLHMTSTQAIVLGLDRREKCTKQSSQMVGC
ncbi:hypothetical protein DITRI_Ditri15bG0009700 [Diplodiscus trichospermus]